MKKTRIVIEASPIAEDRISGIGHMTLEIIKALEKHPGNQQSFQIVLAIPFDKRANLDRWGFTSVHYRQIPLPLRVFNLAWKYDLLPPMDLWLGRGVYIFPNYKNWRLLASRSLTYVCDISYLLFPQFAAPKNQRFLAKNIHKWIKRSDKILAISQSAQQEIIDQLKVDPSKMLLVPCGVDPAVFYPRTEKEIAAIKKQLGIKKEYILYLGNLEPRKNIERLVAAYTALPAKLRTAYSLVLVGGGGWQNESIMATIKQAQTENFDIIHPESYIADDELPALHSGSTLLIHPALYEGFGIAPLQAMACGTPVVVANNSSLPEVVGDAGVLVDAEDSAGIATVIERVLQDRRLHDALGRQGVKQAQKFNWANSADRLVQEAIRG